MSENTKVSKKRWITLGAVGAAVCVALILGGWALAHSLSKNAKNSSVPEDLVNGDVMAENNDDDADKAPAEYADEDGLAAPEEPSAVVTKPEEEEGEDEASLKEESETESEQESETESEQESEIESEQESDEPESDTEEAETTETIKAEPEPVTEKAKSETEPEPASKPGEDGTQNDPKGGSANDSKESEAESGKSGSDSGKDSSKAESEPNKPQKDESKPADTKKEEPESTSAQSESKEQREQPTQPPTTGAPESQQETPPELIIAVTAGDIAENGFTRALQDALDEAYERSISGTSEQIYTVVVDPGTYQVGERTLCVKSNTTVDLRGVTLNCAGPANFCIFKNGDIVDSQSGYFYKNITFRGGTLNGNGGQVYMIRMAHAYNVLIDGMAMMNNNTAHFMEFAACHDITIRNSSFQNSTSADGHFCEAIQFDVMTDYHFGTAFFHEALPNYNMTVSGCTFRNVMSGVGSHTGYYNAPFHHINIVGNLFDGIVRYPIQTFNWTDSNISSNTIQNAENGILVRLYGSFGSADGVFPRTNEGYSVPGDCRLVVQANVISLKSNSSSSDCFGIRVCGLNYTAKQNNADGSGDIPFGSYPLNGCQILNNTISSNTYGIRLSVTGNGIYVNGNTLKSVDGSADKNNHGIFLAEGSKAAQINSNQITVQGIAIYAHDSSEIQEAYANTVRSGLNQGIRAGQNSKIAIVAGNVITYSALSGIFVSDSSVITTASDNILNETGDHGIYAYNSSNFGTIKNNRIDKSAKTGILLLMNSVAQEISGNTIANTKEAGIMLNSASVGKILSNSISSPGNYGVFVHNASSVGEISKNTINTAPGAGIALSNPSQDGVVPRQVVVDLVSDNTINNANEGVKLYHYCKVGNLKNNTIDGSAKNGLTVGSNSMIDAMSGITFKNCNREISCSGDSRIP